MDHPVASPTHSSTAPPPCYIHSLCLLFASLFNFEPPTKNPAYGPANSVVERSSSKGQSTSFGFVLIGMFCWKGVDREGEWEREAHREGGARAKPGNQLV